MSTSKINYSPDYKSDADKRDEVDAAAIASYYPSVQGSEKIALEEDIVKALQAARAESAGVSSLERAVVEAAKAWHETMKDETLETETPLADRDPGELLAYEAPLYRAIDALLEFEQKQK